MNRTILSTELLHAWSLQTGQTKRLSVLLGLWCLLLLGLPLQAQENSSFNLFDALGDQPGLGGLGAQFGEELTLLGQFEVTQGSREGTVSVTAVMADGWHVYSLTQRDGGPQKSELKVLDSPQFQVLGPFAADQPPQIKKYEYFPVPVEEHGGQVIWTAPIQLAEGVDPEQLTIQVQFNGQVCEDDGRCIPIQDRVVDATFAGFAEAQTGGSYRTEEAHVEFQAAVTGAATPGGTLELSITATPDEPDWHIYALNDEGKLSKPTVIAVAPPSGWTASAATTDSVPIKEETGLKEQTHLLFHEEPVTWRVTLAIPEDAEPGTYTLQGFLGFQTCTHTQCDLPVGARFTASIPVAEGVESASVPLQFASAEYEQATDLAAKVAAAQEAAPATPSADTSSVPEWNDKPIAMVLLLAFVAGLILNVMPCVLPVIGLKIMSFVQQAGEDRMKILSLNIWFSLGVLSVFWLLATATVLVLVFAGETFGWADQFTLPAFRIAMAAIVFVFALAFLGVWEVPIPGFVGSNKAANELEQQEGPLGAFTKGVLATLLATPCTGPLLGPAVGWAIAQPAWLTYAAFTCIGLGMASPFLVIGAFPAAIRWLPKPGLWMETFKQLMGFVLLLTVVWIMSSLTGPYMVPTLLFGVGLGFACWLVGRISITATTTWKLMGWAMAVASAAFVGFCSYTFLMPSDDIPWVEFSRATLDEEVAEGNVVFVDFTADW